MTPRHHAPDDLLLGYAAGSLGEAESLLLATHLALCPECRSRHEGLEAIGGAMLETVAPATISPDVLSAMLSMLDLPEPPPSPRPTLPAAFADLSLPGPLRDYVATSGLTEWEMLIPGVLHQITLPVTIKGTPVRLTRMRGGFKVPRHTHEGRELNLVLAGGFHDRGEGFGPGDISDRNADVTHELNIDPGEPCILLAVNDNPLVPVGMLAHVASWLVGF
ncbi:MAG: putative transcriptional regulator [Myxococcota bacterium]|jgi:putative transcriptional regulator